MTGPQGNIMFLRAALTFDLCVSDAHTEAFFVETRHLHQMSASLWDVLCLLNNKPVDGIHNVSASRLLLQVSGPSLDPRSPAAPPDRLTCPGTPSGAPAPHLHPGAPGPTHPPLGVFSLCIH